MINDYEPEPDNDYDDDDDEESETSHYDSGDERNSDVSVEEEEDINWRTPSILWFEDGDMTFHCPENDEGWTYAFRVHRSKLARYPELLRAFTRVPPGTVGKWEEEDPNSAPKFLLNEDDRDTMMILAWIYDVEKYFRPDFIGIARLHMGTLKLAHKFRMHDLKHRIFAFIQQDWPTNLAAWDERELVFYRRWEAAPHNSMDAFAPEPAFVILVARQHAELREILPAVFYHLSRVSRDNSRQKRRGDGLKPRSALMQFVSDEDKRKSALGRKSIVSWIGEVFEELDLDEFIHEDDDDGASGILACCDEVKSRLPVILEKMEKSWDPLKTLGDNFSAKVQNGGLCERCDDEWDRWVGEIRQTLFDSLEDFFPGL